MFYLDNSATTKPYPEVVDTFTHVSKHYFGNPSSLHKLGNDAENLLAAARQQLSKLIHVKENEVIFTAGGTEGNNLAIKGAALAFQERGKHVITTEIEHPSVLEAFQQLKEWFGFEITYLPVNQYGYVMAEALKKVIREDTTLVSVMHVNNEVGTIQPIKEIGQLLQAYPKILFHVDAVQSIGKVPLLLKENQIDLCTFSGHKFHGLKGTGFLYVRQGVKIVPLFSGGAQESRFRSGTENLAGIVSMAKALRLTFENYSDSFENLNLIKNNLVDQLFQLEGVVINTPQAGSAPHIVNISIPGIKPEVLLHLLEEEEIYVSTTSACSSKKKKPSQTLLAMGKGERIAGSSIRISLSYDHTEDMIEPFCRALAKSIGKLKKVMR
ncbi:cysteine desulfurase family protein [Metabacillus arenae]|uniref:Cysteine desulfurase n=1 Tax=Metabacillus arenae TaxID=2771434 RepID=A0A926RX06_9BACI|nr:cysteine desulfurase family protein [Metabacillus arenae]MBD1380135.1 cysteine desulfurase [Metabacillus arenae]